MLYVTKPSEQKIRRFLDAQAALPFSYAAVGASAGQPPGGFVVDKTRVVLGRGEADFLAAKAKLRDWQAFRIGWVEPCWASTPIEPGQVFGVLAKVLGTLWSLNACRIIYTVDESSALSRFGFAYGTLPDHAGRGEERLTVEWDRASNDVFYDILAFSRPNQWTSRIGYPYMRRKQQRFGVDSAAAMRLHQSSKTSRRSVAR